jgi:hypothetical protein
MSRNTASNRIIVGKLDFCEYKKHQCNSYKDVEGNVSRGAAY